MKLTPVKESIWYSRQSLSSDNVNRFIGVCIWEQVWNSITDRIWISVSDTVYHASWNLVKNLTRHV